MSQIVIPKDCKFKKNSNIAKCYVRGILKVLQDHILKYLEHIKYQILNEAFTWRLVN